MVLSIRAVPPIWVNAPSRIHGAKLRLKEGSRPWLQLSTATRNRIAKGKPNRKRTSVAPSAPSCGVNSRCMALRAVWPADPSRVNATQRNCIRFRAVARGRA